MKPVAASAWKKTNARRWLQVVGRQHVRNGLESEGETLLALCRVCAVSEDAFRRLIKEELWWENDLIDEAVEEVLSGTGPAAKRVINTGGAVKYFVMLRGDRGEPVIVRDGEGELALYDSREAAEFEAEGMRFCSEYGYRVYEWRENGELEAE